MVSLMTAALAAGSARKWDNLKALVVDPSVRHPHQLQPQSMLEATNPWAPFDDAGWTANVLARAASQNQSFDEALADFVEKRVGKYHTPVAEWLYASLRPIFLDQWPDDDAYQSEFDRAEVVLGVLAQDAVNVRVAGVTDGRGWGRSRWFGRSTWRAAHHHGNPVNDLQHELATEGAKWGPLRGELFGGEVERAQAALEKYGETFAQVARSRMF
jgi:hypothetical protein